MMVKDMLILIDSENELKFYIDGQGEVTITNGYVEINVNNNSNLIIYLNKVGQNDWFKNFDEIGPFKQGRAKVRIGNNWGHIDAAGNVTTPIIYQNAMNFTDVKLALVRINNKWGYVDKQGNVVVPIIYDNINLFHDGELARAEINNRCGFVDLSGNQKIPIKYEDVRFFSDGYALVSIN